MRVAVIGGGAAGFFAAISCKTHHPDAAVIIFEKSTKLLSKVKVSGGGRCNVTHACFNNTQLSKYYPRGEKQLKKVFNQFNVINTVNWFEQRGVKLKTEADNRMFPVTDDSQTIIDCLLIEIRKLNVRVETKAIMQKVEKIDSGFKLLINNNSQHFDKVIIATGGGNKISDYDWLKNLGHHIENPVPSLFTFNMPDEPIKQLMGVVADQVLVKIKGIKLKSEGPLLITHWGMSGPAILKLSAWGARILNDLNYKFEVLINWVGEQNEELVKKMLVDQVNQSGSRKLTNKNPFQLPNRLWSFLLNKIAIDEGINWNQLGKKNLNRLVNVLVHDTYNVKGKTTFKEEFVTCGGVSWADVDINTMQSKVCKNLYFAGEVLDVDGITGGFNFQAAWTTGYIAGKLLES